MDFYNELMLAYGPKVIPLLEKQSELTARKQEYINKADPERDAAKINILKRKIEEAIAEGNKAQAEDFRSEIAAIEQAEADRQGEVARLQSEINEIVAQIHGIASDIAESLFEAFIDERDKAALAFAGTCDDIESSYQNFCSETGAKVPGNFKARLRLTNHNVYRRTNTMIYEALSRWLSFPSAEPLYAGVNYSRGGENHG
jgi:hypothetical protein